MNQQDDPLLQAALARLLGPAGPGGQRGRPLDAGVRARLERLLGRNLADVRIHDSDLAAAVARRLGADAVTVGGQVLGGAGQLNPADPRGFALVAHEAAHAVQQLAPAPVLGLRAGDVEPMYGGDGPFAAARGTPPLALAPVERSGLEGLPRYEAAARRVEALAGGQRRPPQPAPPPAPAAVAERVYQLMTDDLRTLRERASLR